jgi:alcohol dehydrogenase YqhD (iron-dependent ADH family)
MRNFQFYAPTRIFFGQDQIEVLGKQVKQYAHKILLVYGKGSIKSNGIYDAVVAQLQSHDIAFVELAGVDPNPRLATVIEGADLCREHDLTFILAVGGGSVIDCAKGIAAAACYAGDPWNFWAWKVRVAEALPIGAVLTLSATGSEMNSGTVITNEKTTQKHGMGAEVLFPQFSILDPAYTFTVPPQQTAAGVADILAHVYEFYFSPVSSAYLQDALAEAVMKTCVEYGPIAYAEPDHYEARANLMWASSMALNGTVSAGKTFDGFNHIVEHAISAIYDLTHGVGLAILAPHWMAYVLDDETVDQFVLFARNVWGLNGDDRFELAQAGIQKVREFYRSLGLPGQLSEVGIDDAHFDEIVTKSVLGEQVGSFKKLDKQDVLKILIQAK